MSHCLSTQESNKSSNLLFSNLLLGILLVLDEAMRIMKEKASVIVVLTHSLAVYRKISKKQTIKYIKRQKRFWQKIVENRQFSDISLTFKNIKTGKSIQLQKLPLNE